MFVSPPESPKRGTDGSSSMGTRGLRILSGLPGCEFVRGQYVFKVPGYLAASLPHLCHRSLLHRQRSNGIGGEQHLFHKASSSKFFWRACDTHPKFLTWRVVSKKTLIMHISNVLLLTVSKRTLILHISNVLLLTTCQVKNLGRGSHD